MRHSIAQTVETLGVASVLAGAYLLAGLGLVLVLLGAAAIAGAVRADSA